jgi:hypothetical protein
VAHVEPFITLETNEIRAEGGCDGSGERRFANTGLSFEEQRALKTKCEKQRDRQPAIGDVVLFGETLLEIGDGSRRNGGPLTKRRSIAGSPGAADYLRVLRRRAAAINPDPTSSMVAGSGTA